MPPRELWLGYGENIEEYLATGLGHTQALRDVLHRTGFAAEQAGRILDFGCGAGRMVRWLHDLAGACEVWGTDVRASAVLWCQQHLSPPFHFATTTLHPHLPFADRSFGLVYAAWTSSGTGSGYAKAGTAQALTTVDVSASTTATLYPGSSGNVLIKISNPNPYPVRVTSVTGNGPITADADHAPSVDVDERCESAHDEAQDHQRNEHFLQRKSPAHCARSESEIVRTVSSRDATPDLSRTSTAMR